MLNKKGKKMTQIKLDKRDISKEFTDIVFKGMIQVLRNKEFDVKGRDHFIEGGNIFVSMDEVNDFTNWFINSVGIELLESVQNTPDKRSSESTDFKGSGFSKMGVQ